MQQKHNIHSSTVLEILFFGISLILLLLLALSPEHAMDAKLAVHSEESTSEIIVKTVSEALPEKIHIQPEQLHSTSAILMDITDNSPVVLFQKETTQLNRPASLAKLFVIQYALSLTAPDAVTDVRQNILDMIPADSSTAQLRPGRYTVKNLLAGMLIPSGNDAALALAAHCGSLLDPSASTDAARIAKFIESLNQWMKDQGFVSTVLYDPSGYSDQATTSIEDLEKVISELMQNPEIREIVSSSEYTAISPDGEKYIWKNTNQFLNPHSPYYDSSVSGIKTGSLRKCYNLAVTCQQGNRTYLAIHLGADTDKARYQDMHYVLQKLHEINGK